MCLKARRPASTKCAAAKAFAYEARIIEDLVQPLGDLVRRAEWTYPYDVAASALQYRIATTPAPRKDALPKLAEDVARCAGVLAVAVQIDRDQGSITRYGNCAPYEKSSPVS
ncbi:hypothetical protein ABT167_21645 [Streptomyces sp. NPDC001792]|uniref:hypothetical protein n=1 Tax=Streptomyces sp. NPDC001792 TaxID=3154524 RepID=UPI00331D7B55